MFPLDIQGYRMARQELVAVFLEPSEEDEEVAVHLCWDVSLVLQRFCTSYIYYRFEVLDEIKTCND